MYIINGISKFRNEFYIIYLKFLAIYKKKDKKKKFLREKFFQWDLTLSRVNLHKR